MTDLMWEFEIVDAAEGAALAAAIEARLKGVLGPGAEVEAAPPQETRSGVEVALVILTAVTIVRSGRELTEEVARLLAAIRTLTTEFDGLRGVFLKRDGKRVPLEEVTEGEAGAP